MVVILIFTMFFSFTVNAQNSSPNGTTTDPPSEGETTNLTSPVSPQEPARPQTANGGAQSERPQVSFKQVLQNRMNQILEEDVVFPRRIAVIRSLKDSKKGYGVLWKNYEQMSGLKIVPGSTVNWSWVINGFHWIKDMHPLEHLQKILEMTQADAVIHVKRAAWELITLEQQKLLIYAKKPRPKSKDKKSIKYWIEGILGYNSMVLAKQTDLYFIHGFDEMKVGDQGIVFGKSHNHFQLSNHKVIGILEIVGVKDGFGIAKVILGRLKKPLQSGSKIRFISGLNAAAVKVEEE